jgi:predicted nucleic acid-binding protein
MILVDTSVWIDHLRRGVSELERLLDENTVLVHPFIIGELACGNLRDRAEVLGHLQNLPRSVVASDEEVLHFIESHQLMGQGVGFLDVHLLASAQLSENASIWTRDRKLAAAAARLSMSH